MKFKKYDQSDRKATLMSAHLKSMKDIRAIENADKLDRAEIIHEGSDLPFGCEYCTERFGNSRELTDHLAKHLSGKMD